MPLAEGGTTFRLGSVDEVPEGSGREFRVGKRFIAVFHHGGEFFALEDACPHAGAPLSEGPVHNGTIMCMWHAWRFNLRDGVCVNIPKAPPVPTYPLSIRDGGLFVTLPDDDEVPSSA